MAITERQDIPTKQQEKRKWTFKNLLPVSAVRTLIKPFTEPWDILLGYCILILGLSQLFGQKLSWLFFIVTILVLSANVYERYNKPKV